MHATGKKSLPFLRSLALYCYIMTPNLISLTTLHICLVFRRALSRTQNLPNPLAIIHNSIAALPNIFAIALTLLLSLSLSHCSNSGGGGGGGGGAATANKIYLWLTGCKVPGNMNGCGNTTTGFAGANNICSVRYQTDVSSSNRTRIAAEGSKTGGVRHTALITQTTSGVLRDELKIRGQKDAAVTVARPDGTTTIATNWADLFNPAKNLKAKIVSTSTATYIWTGLQVNAGVYSKRLECGTNWDVGIGSNSAYFGQAELTTSARFGSTTDTLCSYDLYILCITH